MEDQFIIRKYANSDRQSIRDIACDTAFLGSPAESFFEGRALIADFLTAYFTDFEPESCFVTCKNNQIAGYVIGTKNIKKMTKTFIIKILPALLLKSICSGIVFKRKNIKFFWWCFYGFLKGQFFKNINLKYYPALLHINLKKGYRNKGLGTLLLNTYMNYLKSENISGVYLSAHSEKTAKFFAKNGFEVLRITKRSYYREALHHDINYYFFGMKLNRHLKTNKSKI